MMHIEDFCASSTSGAALRPRNVALRRPIAPLAPRKSPAVDVSCDAASMQFFPGVEESSIPEVSLMRSRTGTNGSARIVFENPSLFQASSEMGEITGLYLVDDEVSTLPTAPSFPHCLGMLLRLYICAWTAVCRASCRPRM